MSDFIDRQAAMDAIRWQYSLAQMREVIAELPSVKERMPEAESAWKPASEKPWREGKYLAVCGKYSRWYELLYYGEYEDESETVKHGWYRIDDDSNYIDYDDGVRCWTELPEMPEADAGEAE